MTHDDKIKYMRIAANICGFGMADKHVDLLVRIYDIVVEKQGDVDIRTIARLEEAVENAEALKTMKKVYKKEKYKHEK